jgi:simple sugar transport system permease protein
MMAKRTDRDLGSLLRDITQSSWLVVALAIGASLLLSSLLVIAVDPAVAAAGGHFFARPSDWFNAVGSIVSATFTAMFQGAVFNAGAASWADKLQPLAQTFTVATPLIFAGLGLGVGFRAGLFNIGAQGQMIIGALMGGYIGFAWHLPIGLHLLLAVLGTIIGGALWGFIPGLLKAKTGAHEVITTIMLNYVALNLIRFALQQHAFQRPGSDFPKSPIVDQTAQYPLLFGWLGDATIRLHVGFVLALLTAWGVWWLMERSTWGFQFRAVGANPHAAKTAGMSIGRSYILVMVIAGALAGLAGSAQILGTEKALTEGIAASYGFDAITVALLGRSRPLGTVLAAFLFGALRAAGPTLQVQAGLPNDIVLVIQSLIVLFIAAPPLVRFLFRLPKPTKEEVVTA